MNDRHMKQESESSVIAWLLGRGPRRLGRVALRRKPALPALEAVGGQLESSMDLRDGLLVIEDRWPTFEDTQPDCHGTG